MFETDAVDAAADTAEIKPIRHLGSAGDGHGGGRPLDAVDGVGMGRC